MFDFIAKPFSLKLNLFYRIGLNTRDSASKKRFHSWKIFEQTICENTNLHFSQENGRSGWIRSNFNKLLIH